jgi:hypothetical protein
MKSENLPSNHTFSSTDVLPFLREVPEGGRVYFFKPKFPITRQKELVLYLSAANYLTSSCCVAFSQIMCESYNSSQKLCNAFVPINPHLCAVKINSYIKQLK